MFEKIYYLFIYYFFKYFSYGRQFFGIHTERLLDTCKVNSMRR